MLDASIERGGEHLRSAFGQETRPTASQVVEALPGIFEMHFAVVTAEGAPLVAPIDGILYRGRVWVGIPPRAVRARLVRRDPRVSASYNASEFAFIVHGQFHEPSYDDGERLGFAELARSLYIGQYGDWFGPWMDERDRTTGPASPGTSSRAACSPRPSQRIPALGGTKQARVPA
ncbi:MAG TPA: hypothetical protein VM143_14345 [Acidimicrobiales bacterium]|nr:hypothetical protein [Acidimicrobiales bacterium]